MIVTRTPLRISFVGGGTDLPAFYTLEPGVVLSAAIDKYVYVTVNDKFDGRIRVSYAVTENVSTVNEIRHDIVRNALRRLKYFPENGIEITTVADVPSRGTGLGSSSAMAVGLLNALFEKTELYVGETKERRHEAARLACDVEMNLCRKPIGKQDQWASAVGGMNMLRFYPDGFVEIQPVPHARRTLDRLLPHLLLLYLGERKIDGDSILRKQCDDMPMEKINILRKMADLAERMFTDLSRDDINCFGGYMHENWQLKKQLCDQISTPEINELYDRAIRYGANGGKVLGAGSGGFLLLHVDRDKRQKIANELKLREIKFSFDYCGTSVVYADDRKKGCEE